LVSSGLRYTELMNYLIAWNVVLTFLVGLLMVSATTTKSTYDTAQDTVICNYIDNLKDQTGADTKLMPNCQGDITALFNILID
jgi:hypothetical protein